MSTDGAIPGALGDWARDELPDMPFVAPPGTKWSYSNPGINLAARVAEVAAEQWYAELMQTLVFDPLGMTHTTLDPTVAMTWPLALSHARNDEGALQVQHRAADNVAQYPSAFAYSTALDLARFARMQLNDGELDGQLVLSPESVAEMQRPQTDRKEGPGTSYGLCLAINDGGGVPRVGHTGGILSYGCVAQADARLERRGGRAADRDTGGRHRGRQRRHGRCRLLRERRRQIGARQRHRLAQAGRPIWRELAQERAARSACASRSPGSLAGQQRLEIVGQQQPLGALAGRVVVHDAALEPLVDEVVVVRVLGRQRGRHAPDLQVDQRQQVRIAAAPPEGGVRT